MMSGPGLVDTHAHLDDPKLHDDLPDIIERARLAGVVQVIAIGTTAADSASVIETVRRHRGVFAAVGVHPNEAGDAKAGDWDRIVALATEPEVVAIGETGLDRYWDKVPFPTQQEWFERHLDLAHARNLPVVIHSRDCDRDIIDQLAQLGRPVRGVLHSFTGGREEADAYLALGLHLSFAGMLTFRNKSLDPLRQVASEIPIDRLLVETDSPYLTPHPHRGSSNEPARVALTAAKLAEVRGLSADQLAEATTRNARRLFHLPETATL